MAHDTAVERVMNGCNIVPFKVNEVYHGDCLKLMKHIPDGMVDFILTDPPYGIDFRSTRPKKRADDGKIANDSFDEWRGLLTPMFLEFKRVLTKEGCCACFNGGGNKSLNTSIFILEATKHFNLVQVLVWKKNMGLGWRYRPAYETIVVLSNDRSKYNFYDVSRRCTNVIDGISQVIPKATDHPTPKPIKLLRRLLEIHSLPGQLILDPFAGGGSTGVACKETGRDFILMELDERYCNMARKRIAAAVPDDPLAGPPRSVLDSEPFTNDFEVLYQVNWEKLRVTRNDWQAAGYCNKGVREFCDRHHISYKDVLETGMPALELQKLDDHMARVTLDFALRRVLAGR